MNFLKKFYWTTLGFFIYISNAIFNYKNLEKLKLLLKKMLSNIYYYQYIGENFHEKNIKTSVYYSKVETFANKIKATKEDLLDVKNVKGQEIEEAKASSKKVSNDAFSSKEPLYSSILGNHTLSSMKKEMEIMSETPK